MFCILAANPWTSSTFSVLPSIIFSTTPHNDPNELPWSLHKQQRIFHWPSTCHSPTLPAPPRYHRCSEIPLPPEKVSQRMPVLYGQWPPFRPAKQYLCQRFDGLNIRKDVDKPEFDVVERLEVEERVFMEHRQPAWQQPALNAERVKQTMQDLNAEKGNEVRLPWMSRPAERMY